MGEMHRTDQPQGEKEEMVPNQAPPEFEALIAFVPIAPERQREVHREHDYVSMEVPPPADEAGGG